MARALSIQRPGLFCVIADQAGFHLPAGDIRIPANLRLLLLPLTALNSTRWSASVVSVRPATS